MALGACRLRWNSSTIHISGFWVMVSSWVKRRRTFPESPPLASSGSNYQAVHIGSRRKRVRKSLAPTAVGVLHPVELPSGLPLGEQPGTTFCPTFQPSSSESSLLCNTFLASRSRNPSLLNKQTSQYILIEIATTAGNLTIELARWRHYARREEGSKLQNTWIRTMGNRPVEKNRKSYGKA